MTNTKSGHLLFLSKLCQPSSSERVNDFYVEEDLDAVFNLAVQHGVTALLKHNKSLVASEKFKTFYQKIDGFNQHKTIATQFFDTEVISLLKVIVDKKIPCVVLKGFALARTIYPQPSMRTKADIDLLIFEKDVEQVKNIFATQGYFNPRGWEPKAILNQFTQRKILSDKLNVDFDVHLKISNNKRLENILSIDALLNKSTIDLETGTNLVGNVHGLLHAIFHLMNHRSHGDLIKLIWFYDIYLLCEKLSEQEQSDFYQLVKESGLSKVAIKALELTADYFDANSIHQITNKIIPDNASIEFDSLLQINDKNTLFKETLSSHNSLKSKWLFLREIAFPPPAEIYAKYGKQNKLPLAYLYLRRIVGGLKKHFRKADRNSR